MKKLVVTLCIVLGTGLNVCAGELLSGAFVDFAGMQSPQNQFRLLQQEQFRHEEYNEFKDMKQQKEERNKKIKLEKQQQTLQEPQPVNLELIKDEGELKLVPVKAE